MNITKCLEDEHVEKLKPCVEKKSGHFGAADKAKLGIKHLPTYRNKFCGVVIKIH